jgi:hypothetical protein
MTALYQTFVSATGALDNPHDAAPVKLRFEGNKTILRAAFRLAGSSLLLSAPGLWLLPGSNMAPELMLFKLGSSVFFLFAGLALLIRNRAYSQPEVYFDPIRRELRVLQKSQNGRPQTVLRRGYDSLGGARITRKNIELWDVDGTILLSLPLYDAGARSALRDQLGPLCR